MTPRGVTVPPNKGMKLTSVEHNGRSQLIPGVRWATEESTPRPNGCGSTCGVVPQWPPAPVRINAVGGPR